MKKKEEEKEMKNNKKRLHDEEEEEKKTLLIKCNRTGDETNLLIELLNSVRLCARQTLNQ